MPRRFRCEEVCPNTGWNCRLFTYIDQYCNASVISCAGCSLCIVRDNWNNLFNDVQRRELVLRQLHLPKDMPFKGVCPVGEILQVDEVMFWILRRSLCDPEGLWVIRASTASDQNVTTIR
jgi:hypothetical protein